MELDIYSELASEASDIRTRLTGAAGSDKEDEERCRKFRARNKLFSSL